MIPIDRIFAAVINKPVNAKEDNLQDTTVDLVLSSVQYT